MTLIAGAGSGSINQRSGSVPKCHGSATLHKGIGLFGILYYSFSPHYICYFRRRNPRGWRWWWMWVGPCTGTHTPSFV